MEGKDNGEGGAQGNLDARWARLKTLMPVPGRDAPRCKWSVLRCFTSRGAAGARCPAYRKASCEERGGRRWWSGGVRCKRRTGPRGMEETPRGRHEKNWRTPQVATNSCCGTPNPTQRIHISGNLRRHNLKPLPSDASVLLLLMSQAGAMQSSRGEKI